MGDYMVICPKCGKTLVKYDFGNRILYSCATSMCYYRTFTTKPTSRKTPIKRNKKRKWGRL